MKTEWEALGVRLGNMFDLFLPLCVIGGAVWVVGKLLRWWS